MTSSSTVATGGEAMKRWSTVTISAVATFVLTLAGMASANFYVTGPPAVNCKAIYGLPQVGQFGELWTNPEDGPYGNTYFGVLSCFYNEPYSDISTGALIPDIADVSITAYDGDPRVAPLHDYDVRAALCMQDWTYNFWWCSASSKWTTDTGWQNILLRGPATGGSDMPVAYGEWSWAWPIVGMTKFVYVYLPPNSTFTGWTVSNAL
jgi:hypothetical protein